MTVTYDLQLRYWQLSDERWVHERVVATEAYRGAFEFSYNETADSMGFSTSQLNEVLTPYIGRGEPATLILMAVNQEGQRRGIIMVDTVDGYPVVCAMEWWLVEREQPAPTPTSGLDPNVNEQIAYHMSQVRQLVERNPLLAFEATELVRAGIDNVIRSEPSHEDSITIIVGGLLTVLRNQGWQVSHFIERLPQSSLQNQSSSGSSVSETEAMEWSQAAREAQAQRADAAGDTEPVRRTIPPHIVVQGSGRRSLQPNPPQTESTANRPARQEVPGNTQQNAPEASQEVVTPTRPVGHESLEVRHHEPTNRYHVVNTAGETLANCQNYQLATAVAVMLPGAWLIAATNDGRVDSLMIPPELWGYIRVMEVESSPSDTDTDGIAGSIVQVEDQTFWIDEIDDDGSTSPATQLAAIEWLESREQSS